VVVTQKIKIVLWLALKNKVLTWEVLKKGISMALECVIFVELKMKLFHLCFPSAIIPSRFGKKQKL